MPISIGFGVRGVWSRLLYDVMTECRYPPPPVTAEARRRILSAWTQGGLPAASQGGGGMGQAADTGGAVVGRGGIQQAAEGLGVRMTDWDADFVAQYFTQHVGRAPTEVRRSHMPRLTVVISGDMSLIRGNLQQLIIGVCFCGSRWSCLTWRSPCPSTAGIGPSSESKLPFS